MDLKQLEYFLAVVENGSISAAARALDARQPTLSVSLKNLEDTLGSTLLHRDARGVKLTASGKVVETAAREVFETLERARGEVSGLEDDEVGEFTVGCNDAVGAYFLPSFMRSFLEATPNVHISLWSGSNPEVRDAVVSRAIDFGLSVNAEPHPDLVMVPLYRDGVELYVSAEETPPRNSVDAFLRIKRGPLIISRRASRIADLITRLESDEALPERVLDCGDLQLVRSLVKEGLGVGLLPRRVARHGNEEELRRLHPKLPGVPEVVYLLYRADLHRTRAALRLKDSLLLYGRTLQNTNPGEHSILPP